MISFDLLPEWWPWALVVLAALILAVVLLRRPRQRIELSRDEDAPRRTLERAPAVPPPAPPRAIDIGPTTAATDLTRLKGLGPKLASALTAQGVFTVSDLANLSEGDAGRIDDNLGALKGRLTRDRLVEQARLLESGDRDAYEARFGKLDGGAG